MKRHSEKRVNEDEVDLRLIFQNLKAHWHYFLISFFTLGIATFLYIHYTLPVYEASSSVLIKDSKNNGGDIEGFLSGDVFGNTKNMATEIGILRSRSVLEETIHELNLEVSYFHHDGFFSIPLYKNPPFKVEVLRMEEEFYDKKFTLTFIDHDNFLLETKSGRRFISEINYENNHRFNSEVKTPYFTLRITKNNKFFSVKKGEEYFFVVNSISHLIGYYNDNMKTEPINKDATIVQITVQDKVKERATDFLNTLGKVYINRDIKDKSAVASLTLKFVDEQLEEISKTLNATENELQQFKETRGTVNLSEESKSYLERVTAIDEERIKAELTLKSLDYLFNYVKENKDLEEMAPASFASPDPLLAELITKLKELQSRKRTLLYGSSMQSPAVKLIDQQIEQTKRSLIENINNIRELTRTNLAGIKGEISSYENSIRKIPNIERQLVGIQRNFTVNENIYLYLLQKKAETGIAKATAVSDNKVLDPAATNDIPVVPNKRTIFVIYVLLSFILPVIIISIKSFFNNAISGREDIEKLSNIPIIGIIGHHNNDNRLVVASKPKSSIAEAFRSIRANLMFFGLSEEHKVVLITSSVGGEGKSFTTLNLATVLSLQHHRVIIVGMDLRKPQLVSDLNVDNETGVSTYLIGQSTLESVIRKTSVEGLDIIPSGPIPPNPAELLAKKETSELLQILRSRYDYIIIDTPPVGIVSDAMMLMSQADINLFILRENYSHKDYIKTINEYYSQGKIKNLCIVLNDAGNKIRGYGYGYDYGYRGYGYYEEDNKRRPFWKK